MSLIDTNAKVGTNGWDVLRFLLRFFLLRTRGPPSDTATKLRETRAIFP